MDCKDNSHSGGGVSGGTAAKLENFWYHYKWHTIAAIFALFVIIVCTVQCASNTKYDIQILYAGDHVFGRTSSDGSYPEYVKMSSTLADFADDYDADAMLRLQRDELIHSLLAGELNDWPMVERELKLIRARFDASKPCILYEVDMPQGDVYLSEHHGHGHE